MPRVPVLGRRSNRPAKVSTYLLKESESRMLVRVLPFAAASLVVVAMCVSFSSPAAAGFHLCNRTSEKVHAAIGYSGGGDITTEGWWNLAPQECVTPISANLGASTNYYVYAYTASEHWSDNSSSTDHSFCIDPTNAFTLYNARSACGYERRYFRYVDTEGSTNCDDLFGCDNVADYTYNFNP